MTRKDILVAAGLTALALLPGPAVYVLVGSEQPNFKNGLLLIAAVLTATLALAELARRHPGSRSLKVTLRPAVSLATVILLLAPLELGFKINHRFGLIQPPVIREMPQGSVDSQVERLLGRLPAVHPESLPTPVASTAGIEDGAPDFEHIEIASSGQSFQEHGSPAPNRGSTVTLRATKSHRILYHATYSTDAYGRRTTVSPLPRRGYQQFLAFLGCSFTFGEGVEDAETYPSQVAGLAPDYRVYNFGILGSSPSEMLAHQLKGRDFRRNQGIEESDGYAFFTFIDDHVTRVLGTMQYFNRNRFEKMRPYFAIVDGKAVSHGSFQQAMPLWTWLSPVMAQSEALRFFHVDLPAPGDGTLRLIAKIFSEMKRETQRNFNAKDLYVIIYPGQFHYARRLVPFIRAEGVPVLDYSSINMFQLLRGHDMIPGTGHPSREAYNFLAELIVEDLKDRQVIKPDSRFPGPEQSASIR